MVEKIEELRSEFNSHFFLNICSLENREIEVVDTGPTKDGSTRDSVPGPQSGGAAKQEVLNHSLSLREPFRAHPGITSGRMFATPRLAASRGVDPE